MPQPTQPNTHNCGRINQCAWLPRWPLPFLNPKKTPHQTADAYTASRTLKIRIAWSCALAVQMWSAGLKATSHDGGQMKGSQGIRISEVTGNWERGHEPCSAATRARPKGRGTHNLVEWHGLDGHHRVQSGLCLLKGCLRVTWETGWVQGVRRCSTQQGHADVGSIRHAGKRDQLELH